MNNETTNQEQFLSKFGWMQYEDDPRWQSLTKKNKEGETWRKAIKDQFGDKNFDKLMLTIGTPDARRFMSDEAKTKFTIDYIHQPNGLSEAVKFATIGLLTAGVGSGLGTVGAAAKAIGRTLSATKAGNTIGKAVATVGDFSKQQWKNLLKTRVGQGLITTGQTVKTSFPAAGLYLGLENYYSPEGYRKTQKLFNETIDSFKQPMPSATRYGNIAKTVKSGLGDALDLSMFGELKTIAPQFEFGLKNAYDVLKRTKITMPKNTLSCGVLFPSFEIMGSPDKQLYKFISDPSLDGGYKILNTKKGTFIDASELMPALFSAKERLQKMGGLGAGLAKIGLHGKNFFIFTSKSRIPKGINKDDIILDISDFYKQNKIADGKDIKLTTNVEDLESYINNIANSSASDIILLDKYGQQIGTNRNIRKKLQDALKIIHENVTKKGGSLNDAFGNGIKIVGGDKDLIKNNIDYVQIAQNIARNENVAIENGKFVFKNNIIPANSELYYFSHGFEPYNGALTANKDFWFSPYGEEVTSVLPLNYVKLLWSMPEKERKIFVEELRKKNQPLFKKLFENDALKERQSKDLNTIDYIRQVLQERLGSNYFVHAVDRHSIPDSPKIYKDPIPFMSKTVGINPIIYSNQEVQTALARILQRMTGDVGGSMAFGGIKSGLYYTPNPALRFNDPVHYSFINQFDKYPNVFKGKLLNTGSLNPDFIVGPVFDANTFNKIPRTITDGKKFINVEPQIINEVIPTDFNANIAHTSYGNNGLILRKGGTLK